MKLKNIFIIGCFGILLAACTKENNLKDFMTDSWQTTYLKIEMPTYLKSDSLEVYEDKFENNPELIAQSKYNADGTFNAWFINKKGGKISDSEGKWNVKKDTLFVEFYYNKKNIKVSYLITKIENGFIGKSNYDWDNDGAYDDFLLMKTKRIKTD